MKCNNCGKEINDNSKFCGFCGATTVADVPATPATEQNPATFTDQNPTIAFSPVSDLAENTSNSSAAPPANPENNKKDNKKLLIILLSVLVGLLLILSIVLIVINSWGDNDDDGTSSIVALEEMDIKLFKVWYLTQGDTSHKIEITPDGYVIIYSGAVSVNEPFTPISKTKLGITAKDGTNYTFELLGNTLVREKNGNPDGYVYGPGSDDENVTSDVSSEPVSTPANTNNTVSQSPQNIVYSESELGDAIKAYENYTNYLVSCDLGADVSSSEVYDLLSDDQKSVFGGLYEAQCCKTKSQAKNHLSKYLDPKIYGSFNSSSLIEHNGKLYIFVGAVGFVSYESNPGQFVVTRTGENKVSVTTNQFSSGGELYCKTRFDFEYKDGRYKIVKVTDL